MAWVIFILSFVVAGVICHLMNKNSTGTTYAYIKRYVIVWIVVIAILAGISMKLGLI